MKNVVIVGSQWGDEGKGKIVDWLSSEADIVVRFQGGHNAGHKGSQTCVAWTLNILANKRAIVTNLGGALARSSTFKCWPGPEWRRT